VKAESEDNVREVKKYKRNPSGQLGEKSNEK
jgi:hypothetical protein